MNPTQFISWLKDEGLFDIVQDNYRIFQLLLSENIKPQKRAPFLIAGDIGTSYRRASAVLLGCYLLAAKRLGLSYELAIQKPKKRGAVADTTIVDAFSRLTPKSFIALSLSGKLGSLQKIGKSFRTFILYHDHRFVSTTGLIELRTRDFSAFTRAVDVDYPAMQRKGQKLKRLLDDARMVRIMTDAGTHLKIGIEGMSAIANTGVYSSFGGNIPGGEVYIPPKKNQVEGTLVIDGSCKIMDSTVLVKDPVRVSIQEGAIKRITGGAEADALRETLSAAVKRAKYPWGIKRVGELGIGINPKARILGPTIVNEKTLGTAHIAFGSNAWFGGNIYAITHLDQVFLHPKIWVDGKRIILR